MRNFFAGFAACAVALCAGYALASRNSAGTMSLFTPGNPVVSGTSISSSWANNTLADFAAEITDSLSRSGKGGMLAPLRGIDGSVSSPSHSFTNEPGSGLYRIGAADFGLSIGGVLQHEWSLTAESFVQVGLFPDGTVTAPGVGFKSQTNTGLYKKATDTPAISANGILNQEWRPSVTEIHQAAVLDSTLNVTGATTHTAAVTMNGGGTLGSSGSSITNLTHGTCLLNGSATSTCTSSVPTSSQCVCTMKSSVGAPHIISCDVSGTTLTAISGTTTDVNTVTWFCWS